MSKVPIVDNRETLTRFSMATGKKIHEHTVEFRVTKSDAIHAMTFLGVGGKPHKGLPYVDKVDEQNFWNIPGLLQGKDCRN